MGHSSEQSQNMNTRENGKTSSICKNHREINGVRGERNGSKNNIDMNISTNTFPVSGNCSPRSMSRMNIIDLQVQTSTTSEPNQAVASKQSAPSPSAEKNFEKHEGYEKKGDEEIKGKEEIKKLEIGSKEWDEDQSRRRKQYRADKRKREVFNIFYALCIGLLMFVGGRGESREGEKREIEERGGGEDFPSKRRSQDCCSEQETPSRTRGNVPH